MAFVKHKESLVYLTFFAHNDILYQHGELSERFKELVLKTSDSERNLGFESLTLRQRITATLIQVAVIFFL